MAKIEKLGSCMPNQCDNTQGRTPCMHMRIPQLNQPCSNYDVCYLAKARRGSYNPSGYGVTLSWKSNDLGCTADIAHVCGGLPALGLRSWLVRTHVSYALTAETNMD